MLKPASWQRPISVRCSVTASSNWADDETKQTSSTTAEVENSTPLQMSWIQKWCEPPTNWREFGCSAITLGLDRNIFDYWATRVWGRSVGILILSLQLTKRHIQYVDNQDVRSNQSRLTWNADQSNEPTRSYSMNLVVISQMNDSNFPPNLLF